MVRVISTECIGCSGIRIANDDGANLFFDGGQDALSDYDRNEIVFFAVKAKTPDPIKGGRKVTRRPSEM